MSAANLAARVGDAPGARVAHELDLALEEHRRRFGGIRFEVVEVRANAHGAVEFVVRAAGS